MNKINKYVTESDRRLKLLWKKKSREGDREDSDRVELAVVNRQVSSLLYKK